MPSTYHVGQTSANGRKIVAIENGKAKVQDPTPERGFVKHAPSARWYKLDSPTLARLFPHEETHTKRLPDGTKLQVHFHGQRKG